MSNLAQEEADRFFNYKPSATSHPEDKESDADVHSDEDDKPRNRTIRSSRRNEDAEEQDQDTDDDDLAANMSTLTTNRTTYTVPSTVHYANTGPKGVIADAQNYERARKSTLRRTLNSLSETLSFGPNKRQQPQVQKPARERSRDNSSDSDIDLENDDEFMAQWRQQRLAELQEQFSSMDPQSQSQSPSRRRTYGALETVDANGYLNAIESSPKSTHVVVFLHDPDSDESLDVEDELKMLAYKYAHVRFVRMHYQIADMETVEIPALLGYRGGDVFVTMSGIGREGLEDRLKGTGVLAR